MLAVKQVAPSKFLATAAVVGIVVGTAWVTSVTLGQGGRDAQRVADIRTIQQGLVVYHKRNNSFPTSLSLLAPTYIATLPTDPSGAAYFYTAYASTTRACAAGAALGYHLGAALESHVVVAGNTDAPALPLGGGVICAGGTPSVGLVGFDGASDKCSATTPSLPEGGDNCYDITDTTNK